MVRSQASAQPPTNVRTSSRFFAIWATLMLLIMFVAFSRTFYFRPLSEVTDLTNTLGQASLPLYIVLHGTVMTAWFSLFCLQAWLGVTRRIDIHRRLGIIGLVVAALVTITGAYTSVRLISRFVAAGIPAEASAGVVFGNFISLSLFVSLVALAVSYRSVPHTHKRLMFLSNVSIFGPAMSASLGNRMFGTLIAPVTENLPIGNFQLFVLISVSSLVAYDLKTTGRVLRVTAICSIALLATMILRSLTEPSWGRVLVEWLS